MLAPWFSAPLRELGPRYAPEVVQAVEAYLGTLDHAEGGDPRAEVRAALGAARELAEGGVVLDMLGDYLAAKRDSARRGRGHESALEASVRMLREEGRKMRRAGFAPRKW